MNTLEELVKRINEIDQQFALIKQDVMRMVQNAPAVSPMPGVVNTSMPTPLVTPMVFDPRDQLPGELIVGYALRQGVPPAILGALIQFVGYMPPNTPYRTIIDWFMNPAKYESDAEKLRRLALEQGERDVDVPGVGFPVWDKAKVDAVLANWDASMAAGREDLAFYQLSQDEAYALQNRGWTRTMISQKMSQHGYGPAPTA